MSNEFIGTFAKFFTNLTKTQRFELERALSEAQNSKEITSLESSIRLLRRKVDQSLPIPQPVVREIIRGAVIEWEPLTDQRINFYEVDVSSSNIFATFDTFPTFGILTVLDGLTETKFVRVRGVRRDGTTTPYSQTVPVVPTLFGIESHTDEAFYVGITGTEPNTVVGGPGTDLEYTPINPNGNSKVWGFVSTYGDPAIGLFGLQKIVANVVVRVVDDEGFEISETIEWKVSIGEFYNSHGIGPFTVSHPELNQKLQIRLEVRDETTLADGTARTADSTEVLWAHLNAIELGI
jgi:hypothetical protein